VWTWRFLIERGSDVPLAQQLEREVVRAVRDGRLRPGQPVPSSREAADTLGLTRNTVVAAYRELAAQGWLVARPGGRTRVAEQLPTVSLPRAHAAGSAGFSFDPLPPLRHELPTGTRALRLGAGEPDVRRIPAEPLARALGRALRRRRGSLLGYGDPRGNPAYLEAGSARPAGSLPTPGGCCRRGGPSTRSTSSPAP
jgi:GntR family transcriptional regulator / MocR family aminotransferase